jgi:ribosomal protein S18 acetylase RimI-like enzyme
MSTETVSLRPVTPADAAALAELVAELYHAEEPGVLRAPLESRLRLFRHMLEHELAGGARGRFLAVDEAGAPLGSISLRFYRDLAPPELPPHLFVTAVRTVGLADAARFYGYLMRGALSSETALRRGECYIYSVVVRSSARRRGVGATMMAQAEAYARNLGVDAALLRVMAGNEAARRLYQSLGYRIISRTPPYVALFGLPSELMRKELS